VTLFGTMVDASGEVVADFEAQDVVEQAADRAVVDVSLPLPTGAARAFLGLARNRRPLWVIEQPVEPSAIDPSAFGLSPAILSLDVHPLAAPQRPDDPYCFGGLRVVPRGDRAFRTTDAPWLFVVVRAPGSNDANAPQLEAELVIEGEDLDEPRRFPIVDPSPMALRGFEAQWGLGIPLPVASLPPGEYRASLGVANRAAGEHAIAVAGFRVIAP
jgi:hypothetical protein